MNSMKPTKTFDALNSAVKAVLDEHSDLENRLVNFVRERDEVARERDALRAELLVTKAKLRAAETQRQAEKMATFAACYGGVDFAKKDSDTSVTYFYAPRRAGKTLLWANPRHFDQRKAKISASQPISQFTWNLLTLQAANLIREHYRRTPVTRSVHEWNTAANNLANDKPERHGFRWTRSEEEKLVADFRAHKTLGQLLCMHKREPEAIALRLAKLTNNATKSFGYYLAWRDPNETDDEYATRMLKFFFPGGNSRRHFTLFDRKEGVTINYTNYTGV